MCIIFFHSNERASTSLVTKLGTAAYFPRTGAEASGGSRDTEFKLIDSALSGYEYEDLYLYVIRTVKSELC